MFISHRSAGFGDGFYYSPATYGLRTIGIRAGDVKRVDVDV